MTDCEIEYRLFDIRAISELFETYVDYKTEELNPDCLIFLSENLRKNLEEISKILRNRT